MTSSSLFATLCVQASRDPMVVPPSDTVLLEEAMRSLYCSLGEVRINHNNPSSVPMAWDPTITHQKISSLWIPEKMLSTDYSVSKTFKVILNVEHVNTARMMPEDPQKDAGTDLPPPQSNASQHIRLEKQEKWQHDSLAKSGSKRKAPAASAEAGGWD
ncbi:proline-rich protein 22 [Limosa lapponica baueri]|uniref:Proline-rich protein 22 n=1 Tax=Limosa lapponica baueri TaxID=1758121 RepID=A0A2I0U260_LIMLA|nr:proline-rich protein 22 [Limosa lapponica baueri]